MAQTAGARPERGDAAANRRRILSAARGLLTENGAQGLTMAAVATAAGVGKGTVFRRFGDREGLTRALLDDHIRSFQEAFLNGPAPLGPGAPPAVRLEAFIAELLRLQADHLDFALAAETHPGRASAPVYGTLLIHVAALVHELDAAVDERIVAGLVLNAIAPGVVHRMRTELGAGTAELQASALALLRGLTRPAAQPGSDSPSEPASTIR